MANFVSASFDISNVFPRQIDFRQGGRIAAGTGAVFSTTRPTVTSVLPAWWNTCGRSFGVLIRDAVRVAPAAAGA